MIRKIELEGGYANILPSQKEWFQLNYYVKDYLGNIRAVCNGKNGEVLQSMEYTPTGLIFRRRNYEYQPKRFCGKEELTMHGYNMYDSGARFQYSLIPRFSTMDPLCEKYYDVSPYAYCNGDPVNLVDPDGNKIKIATGRKGGDQQRVVNWINKLSQGIFAVDNSGYLYLSKDTRTPLFSSFYKKRLIDAIKSKKNIYVFIDNYYIDSNNVRQPIEKKGGGTTRPYTEGDMIIVVSGKSNDDIKDQSGRYLKDGPEYILMHEFVGHAIPAVAPSEKDTGNAIGNENIVREEVGSNLREENDKHVE